MDDASPGAGLGGDVGCRKLWTLLAVAGASLLTSVVVVTFVPRSIEKQKLELLQFDCTSDLVVGDPIEMKRKGLAVDDASFACPEELPWHWPHTREPVKNIRLFKAMQPGWDTRRVVEFAETLKAYTRRVKARVLLGTQITCNEAEDDADWRNVKMLMSVIGAEHVLGLAVGNEIDILFTKTYIPRECIWQIWHGGYYLRKVQSRFEEMRAMPGFGKVPITVVSTAYILAGTETVPFVDTEEAPVNTFFTQVLRWLKNPDKDWVFTMNFYPYFDSNLEMDVNTTDQCEESIKWCMCFDSTENCLTMVNMMYARTRITRLTGNKSSRFWVGEVGWSSPISASLETTMAKCEKFSSYGMQYEYYKNFLQWDMEVDTVEYKLAGPEVAFYFTIRDTLNFGVVEHFGLVPSCGVTQCKLDLGRVTNTSHDS